MEPIHAERKAGQPAGAARHATTNNAALAFPAVPALQAKAAAPAGPASILHEHPILHKPFQLKDTGQTNSAVKHVAASQPAYVHSPAPVVQRVPAEISMRAGEGDLQANVSRKAIVDRVYADIKKNSTQHSISALVPGKKFLKEAEGKAYKQFQAAGDAEQTAMTKEILARIYHDQHAAEEITPEMRSKLGRGLELDAEGGEAQDPDIAASTITPEEVKSNMSSAKACVITALMFAEGGNVLGAGSIEELHFILSTRFRTTWRHYSEDAVFKSLYEHMGYTKAVPEPARKLQDLGLAIEGHAAGMASIEGHMIGFKQDGDRLYIRDNDEGLKASPGAHSKRNSNVIDYWHK